MKLFEIDERLQACIRLDETRAVDTETGEIIDLEAIKELELEREKKIENIALWYKNLISDAEELKKQKEIFAQREKAAKNKAESLKAFLSAYLEGKPFKCTNVNLTYRKSEAVQCDVDIKDVDDDYLKYAEPTLDKTKIKEAIKSGIAVKGCYIAENKNLQIK